MSHAADHLEISWNDIEVNWAILTMFDNNAEPDVVFLTCVATEDKFPLIQDQLNNLRIE